MPSYKLLARPIHSKTNRHRKFKTFKLINNIQSGGGYFRIDAQILLDIAQDKKTEYTKQFNIKKNDPDELDDYNFLTKSDFIKATKENIKFIIRKNPKPESVETLEVYAYCKSEKTANEYVLVKLEPKRKIFEFDFDNPKLSDKLIVNKSSGEYEKYYKSEFAQKTVIPKLLQSEQSSNERTKKEATKTLKKFSPDMVSEVRESEAKKTLKPAAESEARTIDAAAARPVENKVDINHVDFKNLVDDDSGLLDNLLKIYPGLKQFFNGHNKSTCSVAEKNINDKKFYILETYTGDSSGFPLKKNYYLIKFFKGKTEIPVICEMPKVDEDGDNKSFNISEVFLSETSEENVIDSTVPITDSFVDFKKSNVLLKCLNEFIALDENKDEDQDELDSKYAAKYVSDTQKNKGKKLSDYFTMTKRLYFFNESSKNRYIVSKKEPNEVYKILKIGENQKTKYVMQLIDNLEKIKTADFYRNDKILEQLNSSNSKNYPKNIEYENSKFV